MTDRSVSVGGDNHGNINTGDQDKVGKSLSESPPAGKADSGNRTHWILIVTAVIAAVATVVAAWIGHSK